MGFVGYLLVKNRTITEGGLSLLSQLVTNLFLPLFIFHELTQHFNAEKFSLWWILPLISVGVTTAGFLLGRGMLLFDKECQNKSQFVSLVSFQNSGFIPLILIAALFGAQEQSILNVYIFLFCIGFNMSVWSLGVWLVTNAKIDKDQFKQILNVPFVVTLVSLGIVCLGLVDLIPGILIRPAKMFGDCTLPVSIIVVGGNLAGTNLHAFRKKSMALFILAKMILLPLIALLVIYVFKVGYLLGFILMIEAAVPSAVSLSVIGRKYKVDGTMINQGIFWSSMAGIITIPLFLTLFSMMYKG